MSRANGRASGRHTQCAGEGGCAARANTIHFDIPSDYSASRRVQEEILQAVRHHGYPDRHAYAIQLALDEALINAIKHGNKLDAAKQVHVDASIRRDRARISIEDEGQGFDRTAVPDPTCDENRCKLNGRGILLMESYMDQVQWSHGGRRVTLVKKNK